MRRRPGAKHCSSLCEQSEGGEYSGGQIWAKNPIKSCPRALVMFATCSWLGCSKSRKISERFLTKWHGDIATRGASRTFGEGLGRSTVAHFARKVRGGEYCGGQARAKNPTKICPRALAIFATCSWPSLCKQSELQCWRRNWRLCGPAQISAARALLPLKGAHIPG